MDTSKEYKDMSIKATELQDWYRGGNIKEGDFWCCSCNSCRETEIFFMMGIDDVRSINPKWKMDGTDGISRTLTASVKLARDLGFGPYWYEEKQSKEYSFIWLPRQDQLQEMVINSDYAMTYCSRLWDWAGKQMSGHYVMKFASMEQLWLALVMKEKYNKTWNGETWK